MINRLKGLKSSIKKEVIVVGTVFMIMWLVLSWVQVTKWYENQGDTAIYSQLAYNIVEKGTPDGYLGTSTLYFLKSGFLNLPLEDVKTFDLSLPSNTEENFFKFHFYAILYLFKLIPFVDIDVAYPSLIVASFVGLLAGLYYYLRKHDLPIWKSVLFLLVISAHPAWSISIQGQLYPDRFFLALSMILIIFIGDLKRYPTIVAILSVLIIAICERAGIVMGIFLIVHGVLYQPFKSKEQIRTVGLGFLLSSVSTLIMKFYIVNYFYDSYLPYNLSDLATRFLNPVFVHNLQIYLLFNLVLLLPTLIYDKRAFVIAIIMMIPNIIGNVGGAEKIGWLTHYHTYYTTFCFWASAKGLIESQKNGKPIIRNVGLASIGMAGVIFLFANPYSLGAATENIKSNVIIKTTDELFMLSGSNSKEIYKFKKDISDSIPAGSRISAVEPAWLPLYKDHYISFYPIGIEQADYAVLNYKYDESNNMVFYGVPSYQPQDEKDKIDEYLIERMIVVGYDFEHPVYISPYGYAVVKKNN